jgi:hypothetical protein
MENNLRQKPAHGMAVKNISEFLPQGDFLSSV